MEQAKEEMISLARLMDPNCSSDSGVLQGTKPQILVC